MTPVAGDSEPADFIAFDDLLNKICPNLSYLQYKRIFEKCVDTDETYESDYYGGGFTYAYYRCDLDKLFTVLEDGGWLDEIKQQKENWIIDDDPKCPGLYWVTVMRKGVPTSKVYEWNGYEWDSEEEIYAWMPLNVPIPYSII